MLPMTTREMRVIADKLWSDAQDHSLEVHAEYRDFNIEAAWCAVHHRFEGVVKHAGVIVGIFEPETAQDMYTIVCNVVTTDYLVAKYVEQCGPSLRVLLDPLAHTA